MRNNSMTTIMQRSLITISCGIALSVAVSGSTIASQAVGWWGGNWNCNIDGRSARMRWNVVDDSQTTCNGNICSTTSGVRWQGSFSDNGSRWVPLTNPREGHQGGLYFAMPMAINGICPNLQAIEPRAGLPGTVSAIRYRAGDNTASTYLLLRRRRI
jgi:Family of unknown function (DUF6006)